MQRVLDDVRERSREERAIDRDRRQIRCGVHVDLDASRKTCAVRLDDFLYQGRQRRRLGASGRRRGEARKFRRNLAQQLHLREDGVDAVVEDRRQRTPAVDVDATGVLGRQLNRRQRILDVVGDLARHIGPRLQSPRAFELGALPFEVGGHLIEVFDEPPQFVRRRRGDARVEIAARDAAGRARQSVDRVCDPFGHPISERRAEEAEEQRTREHAPVELVNLLLDVQLLGRERDGDDALAATGGDRRRREPKRHGADLFVADEGRQPVEHDASIDVARRAHREQPRRKEIACAGRLQAIAIEQVDVFVDGAPDEHHDLIVDRRQRAGAALLQRRVILDQALRRRDGSCGRLVGAREQLVGEIGPRRDGEDGHRHDDRRDEREEQLQIEARSKFAQQRASARRRPERNRAEQAGDHEQHEVEHSREQHELGQIDQMAQPRDDGVAERVNAVAVVLQVHTERFALAIDRRPESIARSRLAWDHRQ